MRAAKNIKLAYECARNSNTLFLSVFVGFIFKFAHSSRPYHRSLPRSHSLLPFNDVVHIVHMPAVQHIHTREDDTIAQTIATHEWLLRNIENT